MALAATRRRRTASCCARSPCPSPPSAHRCAAGSCARDSRLTHHPCRPAPRHCIRRREHAALSMSPVRGGGSWCPLSRALGVGSRAALAVAGARQLPAVPSRRPAVPSQRRDGVAREQSRLVVAVVRAGRGWGCGWRGRLTTRVDGQPARPARAVHAPRQSRPRGASFAVEAAGAARAATLRSPPRRRPRCRGSLRCKCGRRAIVGGVPRADTRTWLPSKRSSRMVTLRRGPRGHATCAGCAPGSSTYADFASRPSRTSLTPTPALPPWAGSAE